MKTKSRKKRRTVLEGFIDCDGTSTGSQGFGKDQKELWNFRMYTFVDNVQGLRIRPFAKKCKVIIEEQ